MSIGRKQAKSMIDILTEDFNNMRIRELNKPTIYDRYKAVQRERTSEREPDRIKSKAMRRSALTGIRTVRNRQK